MQGNVAASIHLVIRCFRAECQLVYCLDESSLLAERREGVAHPFDFSQGELSFQSECRRSMAHARDPVASSLNTRGFLLGIDAVGTS